MKFLRKPIVKMALVAIVALILGAKFKTQIDDTIAKISPKK